VQQLPRGFPIAHHRLARYAEDSCRFLDAQTAEESQLDHPGFPLVRFCEFVQRVIESQQIAALRCLGVNVAGLTDAADSFAIVKLTNEARSVILVSLTMDGEFIAAMLEPSKQLIETQFVTFSPVTVGLPPVAQLRVVSSFSRELFFSPFVFALEVKEPGAPAYFVRPYDGKRFDSFESTPPAHQKQ
jgi:hypothetical protein